MKFLMILLLLSSIQIMATSDDSSDDFQEAPTAYEPDETIIEEPRDFPAPVEEAMPDYDSEGSSNLEEY